MLTALRRPKIAGMAVFDWLATAAVAGTISTVSHKINPMYHSDSAMFVAVFVVLIFIAISVHYITDTPTMLNAYLGINTYDDVIKSRDPSIL
jgi:hypothetical protein